MLAGTITEGAHYFTDLFAGTAMAFFAYALANRIIALEDRSFQYRPTVDITSAQGLAIAAPLIARAEEATE